MPRLRRQDAPNLPLHIFGRGIARRTVFETRRDIRAFLALLAWEVRAGRIEILVFTVLTTHFHLFVRSLKGEISEVMQRVLNLYVRYFNRTRRRDGSLFRGRFGSRPVRGEVYPRRLVPYIDQNAEQARLTSDAAEYPYGSKYYYLSAKRPPWLSTDWVDERLGWPRPEDRRRRYEEVFGAPLSSATARWIERRMEGPPVLQDDLDDLLGAAPPRVLEWMIRKAKLADGTQPGVAHADAETLEEIVRAAEEKDPDWLCKAGSSRRSRAWPILGPGLLHDVVGMTDAEIGRRAGCSDRTIARRVAQHRFLIGADAEYGARAAALVREALLRI